MPSVNQFNSIFCVNMLRQKPSQKSKHYLKVQSKKDERKVDMMGFVK